MNNLPRLFRNPSKWLIDTGGRYRRLCSLMLVPVLACVPLGSAAAIITAQSTPIIGTQWTTSYSIKAQGSDPLIEEFSIYFAPSLYDSLALVSVPAGWDSIVIQPDAGIPADGFLDALSLFAGISPGEALTGFTVSFNYLGSGVPPTQRFDLIDPLSFATIGTGLTTNSAVELPLPGTLPLLSLGFGIILWLRHRSPPCVPAVSRS